MGLFDFYKKKEVPFEPINQSEILSRILNGEEEAQEYTGIPVNKNIVEKWKQKTSFVESIDK